MESLSNNKAFICLVKREKDYLRNQFLEGKKPVSAALSKGFIYANFTDLEGKEEVECFPLIPVAGETNLPSSFSSSEDIMGIVPTDLLCASKSEILKRGIVRCGLEFYIPVIDREKKECWFFKKVFSESVKKIILESDPMSSSRHNLPNQAFIRSLCRLFTFKKHEYLVDLGFPHILKGCVVKDSMLQYAMKWAEEAGFEKEAKIEDLEEEIKEFDVENYLLKKQIDDSSLGQVEIGGVNEYGVVGICFSCLEERVIPYSCKNNRKAGLCSACFTQYVSKINRECLNCKGDCFFSEMNMDSVFASTVEGIVTPVRLLGAKRDSGNLRRAATVIEKNFVEDYREWRRLNGDN